MSFVGTGEVSSVEAGQMPAVETGRMSAAETGQTDRREAARPAVTDVEISTILKQGGIGILTQYYIYIYINVCFVSPADRQTSVQTV